MTINLLDKMKRVKGVGDVSLLTPTDYSMRIWLDPQRLVDYQMTPSDIVNALKKQNVQAAIGRIGAQPALPDQAFQLSIQAQGRLTSVGGIRQRGGARHRGRLLRAAEGRGAGGTGRAGFSKRRAAMTARPPP